MSGREGTSSNRREVSDWLSRKPKTKDFMRGSQLKEARKENIKNMTDDDIIRDYGSIVSESYQDRKEKEQRDKEAQETRKTAERMKASRKAEAAKEEYKKRHFGLDNPDHKARQREARAKEHGQGSAP